MAFAQHDHMIQALAANTANAALHIWILPRRPGGNEVLSQISILGENPKIWYQQFNDLRTPKLPKKQICDRTRRHPAQSAWILQGFGEGFGFAEQLEHTPKVS